jgi:hypothetical protein
MNKLIPLLLLVATPWSAHSAPCPGVFDRVARQVAIQWRLTERWYRERFSRRVFEEPISQQTTRPNEIKILYVPDFPTAHMYIQVGENDIYQGNAVWVRYDKQKKFGSQKDRPGYFEFPIQLTDEELEAVITFLQSRSGVRRFTALSRGAISCSSSVCTALARTSSLKFRGIPVSSPLLVSLYLRFLSWKGDQKVGAVRYVGHNPGLGWVTQFVTAEYGIIPMSLYFGMLVGTGFYQVTDLTVNPLPQATSEYGEQVLRTMYKKGLSREQMRQALLELDRREAEWAAEAAAEETADEAADKARDDGSTP